jgi:RNA polymerase subunit RPABC4/transcription elongation factor Spt4
MYEPIPLAMPTDNLKNIFQTCDLEDGELEVLLSEYFQSSKAVSLNEIIYPGDDSNYAMKLRYNSAGKVSEISSGPALDDTKTNYISGLIQNDLLVSRGTGIGRVILFANVRCAGFFRYKDILQILPVPRVAPQPANIVGEFPFVLEWQFHKSSNRTIEDYRRFNRERHYELLIAGLFPYAIRSLGHNFRQHWVMQHSQGADTDHSERRPSYLQEDYQWEGLQILDHEFSQPAADSVPILDSKEPHGFYCQYGIRVDQRMEMPSCINDLLDTFFSLQAADQERFLRASFWIQHAHIVSSYSRSASFTALISAIESLISDKTERCEDCNRPLSSEQCPKCGVSNDRTTERFKEFVERFGKQSDTTEAQRKKLYAIRSRLSHGGLLFPSDLKILEGLTKRSLEEYIDIGTARRIVSVILVEWLKDQEKLKGSGQKR